MVQVAESEARGAEAARGDALPKPPAITRGTRVFIPGDDGVQDTIPGDVGELEAGDAKPG